MLNGAACRIGLADRNGRQSVGGYLTKLSVAPAAGLPPFGLPFGVMAAPNSRHQIKLLRDTRLIDSGLFRVGMPVSAERSFASTSEKPGSA